MASNSSAVPCLFIFCEGVHDAAFLRLVLKHSLGFNSSKNSQGKKKVFSEYPSPLNQMFQKHIKDHATADLSLDTAHKFFLPYDLLVKGDAHILLFNHDGKDHFSTVRGFLVNFFTLLPSAMNFPSKSGRYLGNVRYLFVLDADHKSASQVVSEKSKALATIDRVDPNMWTMPTMAVVEGRRGAFADNKGFYVWCGKDGRGTLEDLLAPLFAKQADLYQKAVTAMDDMHFWELNHLKTKQAFAARSKRQKAIFTTMGQSKKPGSGLSVIIEQAELLEPSALKNSPEVIAFVAFINEFALIDAEPGSNPDTASYLGPP